MAELNKKVFKGIRQVNLSTYQSYSDKEGYLWLIKDGENRYIYFGNQLYSDIVPEKTDGQTKELITEALDKLIGQDLLHSFDNDGNLKNEIKLDLQTTDDGKEILHLVGKDDEDIATLDMSKFAIDGMVDTVSYDNTTHSLKITWNTESGKSNTVIDLTDLVDIYTSGNGVTVGPDGVVSIKLSDDNQDFLTVGENGLSLKNIDGSHIEIGNTITDDNDTVIDKSSNITDILQKLFTNIKDVKTNALSVKGDGSSINVVPDGDTFNFTGEGCTETVEIASGEEFEEFIVTLVGSATMTEDKENIEYEIEKVKYLKSPFGDFFIDIFFFL